MPLLSIYSKQISAAKIKKLQEYFNGSTRAAHKQIRRKHEPNLIDPNFLFSVELAKRGFLYLKSSPLNHYIGDEVVCLRSAFFGQFGVVVGINDQEYEILFDSPGIGKTDLGGLCSNLWGGRFHFRELLNLQNWPQHF